MNRILSVKHQTACYYSKKAVIEINKLMNIKDNKGNYVYSLQDAIDHLKEKGWKIVNSIDLKKIGEKL